MTFLELVRAKSSAALNSTFLAHLVSSLPASGDVTIITVDPAQGIVSDEATLSGIMGGNETIIGTIDEQVLIGTILDDIIEAEQSTCGATGQVQ